MASVGATGTITTSYLGNNRVDVTVTGVSGTHTVTVLLFPRPWTNPLCWTGSALQIFFYAWRNRYGENLDSIPSELEERNYPGVVTDASCR